MLSISILVMLRFRWYFCISYYFYWFYYMQTMIGCQDCFLSLIISITILKTKYNKNS